MNKVVLATFSSFDAGNKPSESEEPERFYRGFVLGLMVELSDRYTIISNRESVFGCYDVLLKPKNHAAADNNIIKKCYAASLEAEGIPPERIRKYGFTFEGKKC